MSAQKQVQSRRTAASSRNESINKKRQQKSAPANKSQQSAKPAPKKEAAQQAQKNYVETEETNNLIKRAVRCLTSGYPIHLTGRSGAGKTALALEIAAQKGRPLTVLTGNHEMTNEDLLGGITGVTSTKLVDNYIRQVYKKEVNIKENWTPGRLVEAAEKGHTLIYDEFSRSRPETNNLFLSILEERVIPLYGTKQKKSYVPVHPEFNIIFTSNPIEYAGVFEKQDALMDRLITLEVAFTQKTTEMIIQHKAEVKQKDAKFVWGVLKNLQEEVKEAQGLLSIRSGLMIATIAKQADVAMEKGNEEFTQICQDVLSGEVVRFEGTDTFQKASSLVKRAVENAK
ncbi:gas vesicle protein GvpN [Alkalicoccus halolimnae]|uniref:Gas vesicle protein GvpN n=1 Tax=Alkalicoccus halolimnae TaxID=1667239 RepID=A0A5C7F3A3_9BACI|nr:gas vesicle protein GvpN [Alkalicoccus halolimnae]TXF85131.1 gas vesicle protein GvpN [Alkalicoccus halolimnae]